jgi:hypothetical protein
MNKFAALTLSLFLVCGTALADTPKDSDAPPAKAAAAAKPAEKSSAEIAAELESLRQALQSQQEELQLLKEELAKRDRQIDEAREKAATANSRAAEASSKATEAVAASADAKSSTVALNSSVTALKTSHDALVTTVAAGNSAASAAGDKRVLKRSVTRASTSRQAASSRQKPCSAIAPPVPTSPHLSRRFLLKRPTSRASQRMPSLAARAASACWCRAKSARLR